MRECKKEQSLAIAKEFPDKKDSLSFCIMFLE